MDTVERNLVLDREIQGLARGGWRVESRSDGQATVAKGKPVNHLLHFLLSVFTVGVWLLVWFGVSVFGGVSRRLVTVGVDGAVVVRKV
jgi:hypothetical protein